MIDLAYQGLGGGLDADIAGPRALLERVGEALIAYSCDKNFGPLPRTHRRLYALAANAASEIVQSNLLALAACQLVDAARSWRRHRPRDPRIG